MSRTILVTGTASGIGKATATRLRAAGNRVIGVDLRDADIIADLATPAGRTAMVEQASQLAPEGLDGVIAGAGTSQLDNPRLIVALNFFGAVATLEGLRPLLAKTGNPRAVAIVSTASLLPADPETVAACLAGDEERALNAIEKLGARSYPTSKNALGLWLRRTAKAGEWAGSGILLNGVAPGVVKTPMVTPILASPEGRAAVSKSNPIATSDFCEPEELAEALDFLVNFESRSIVGQILFVDGGTDAILRPDII